MSGDRRAERGVKGQLPTAVVCLNDEGNEVMEGGERQLQGEHRDATHLGPKPTGISATCRMGMREWG